ncbi:MAG: hypothetical protein RR612_11730 [Oscillospiraceae bacterium]
MIDCKITENYLKEKERICKGSGGAGCIGCPLFGHCNVHTTEKMRKNIDIVQKWSDT